MKQPKSLLSIGVLIMAGFLVFTAAYRIGAGSSRTSSLLSGIDYEEVASGAGEKCNRGKYGDCFIFDTTVYAIDLEDGLYEKFTNNVEESGFSFIDPSFDFMLDNNNELIGGVSAEDFPTEEEMMRDSLGSEYLALTLLSGGLFGDYNFLSDGQHILFTPVIIGTIEVAENEEVVATKAAFPIDDDDVHEKINNYIKTKPGKVLLGLSLSQ